MKQSTPALKEGVMQTLIELLGDIDSSTTIVTEFDNPLTTMDTSSRQKINRNHWF